MVEQQYPLSSGISLPGISLTFDKLMCFREAVVDFEVGSLMTYAWGTTPM